MDTPGELIRQARRRRGLYQREVAATTGIPLRTLKRIESGEVSFSRHIPVLLRYFDLLPQERVDERPTFDPNDPPLSQASFLQLWAQLHAVHLREIGRAQAQFPAYQQEAPPPERLLDDPQVALVDEQDEGGGRRPG